MTKLIAQYSSTTPHLPLPPHITLKNPNPFRLPSICHVAPQILHQNQQSRATRATIARFLQHLREEIKFSQTSIFQFIRNQELAMSLACTRYTCFFSSSAFSSTSPSPSPSRSLSKQHPSFCSLLKLHIPKNQSFLTASSTLCNSQFPKPCTLIVKASETEAKTEDTQEGEDKYEEYEVELVQPYGIKFTKGRDGATYIDAIAPGGSADLSGKFTVGDKVIATRFFPFTISNSLLISRFYLSGKLAILRKKA